MAHRFTRGGLALLFFAGVVAVVTLILASNPDSIAIDSFGLGILGLVSSSLGLFGAMFFLAGLIGLAVSDGVEEPVRRPVTGVGLCPQCGERENRAGSIYCRECGAQLLTD